MEMKKTEKLIKTLEKMAEISEEIEKGNDPEKLLELVEKYEEYREKALEISKEEEKFLHLIVNSARKTKPRKNRYFKQIF